MDRPVPRGGYQWHYVDGVSDDGAHAIVLIALVGNPFSPAYARARREGGDAIPRLYSALNVALYGPRASAWALRERAIREEDRAPDAITLGASSARWEGDALVVDIDERTTPFGRRIRGRARVIPEVAPSAPRALDRRGEHLWWPVSPLAKIEVELVEPSLSFRGSGYHDANAGGVPLEDTFETWTWARGERDRRALVTYDAREVDGAVSSVAFSIDARGRERALTGLVPHALPRTAWGLERVVRADVGARPRVARTLEDGPFYARDLVDTELDGARVRVVSEALSGARLGRGWVRFLSGFRMGRAA